MVNSLLTIETNWEEISLIIKIKAELKVVFCLFGLFFFKQMTPEKLHAET